MLSTFQTTPVIKEFYSDECETFHIVFVSYSNVNVFTYTPESILESQIHFLLVRQQSAYNQI